jgi:alkylation response protein AidB-like acyl-CoA dehydrogenase
MIRSRSSWDEGGETLQEARPRMKTARTIGLGLLLVAAGSAATLSWAQQTQRPDGRRDGQNQSTRVRLAKLEADVEMLQLEQEAARAGLLDYLKKCDRLELLHETDSLTAVGMALEMAKELTGQDASKDRATAMALSLADDAEKQKIDAEASKDVKKLFDVLNAAKAKRKKDFWGKAMALSEKKIELTEIRKLYQTEAR